MFYDDTIGFDCDYYWSSSEYKDRDSALFVDFFEYEYSVGSKTTDYGASIRPIRAYN